MYNEPAPFSNPSSDMSFVIQSFVIPILECLLAIPLERAEQVESHKHKYSFVKMTVAPHS